MPRIYTLKSGGISQRAQVVEFLRASPHSTLHDIMAHFELGSGQASMLLSRLKRDGVIDSHKSAGEPLQSWFACDLDDDGKDRAPFKKLIKTSWPQGQHQRDDLLTAFFGAAP